MEHHRYEPMLAHHGIKGQRWGVRRFRNKDGSLTSAGKAVTSMDGYYGKNIDRFFTGTKFEKVKAKNAKQVVKKLNEQGDGAYGNLTVQWAYGGRHSLFYKNEKGKTTIYDSQSGETYGTEQVLNSPLFSRINPRMCEVARLDTATPNNLVLSALK